MNLIPNILFEDQHLVVLSKPAGLLSQGEKTGDPNLVDWLRGHFGRHYVGLIHRLDRNTSGAMIVAKRSKSAERLTRDLQEGKLFRSYLGWVEGHLGELHQSIRWHHFLKKDERKNKVQVITRSPQKNSGAKEAILSAKPIQFGTWKSRPVTLVEFTLETGRSHQIRVQSAHEKHPLLGDSKYGNKFEPDFPRPALHSFRITFDHPMTHEKMEFEAPIPDDFQNKDFKTGTRSSC